MIVYRIAQEKYIEDLSGMGSYLYGGRWSRKGTFAIYTAQHRSLAYLEYVVHQFGQDIWPEDLKIATLEIVDSNIIILNEKNLPHMWVKVVHHVETQSVVTKAFEDGSVAISVPSVIVKDERNIILNPLHKDFFQKVTIRNIEPIELDDRFRV